MFYQKPPFSEVLPLHLRKRRSKYQPPSSEVLHFWGHHFRGFTVLATRRRPFVTTNFQLFGHYSKKNQDIFLKFSAFVYHKSVLNWQKVFCNQPASYSQFRPKLWTPLGTVFVEIFWKEKNCGVFRPFPVTHWKEFWISWKKWRFEIFWLVVGPP